MSTDNKKTTSAERRWEKKQAAKNAKRKKLISRIVWILVSVAAVCAIALLVVSYRRDNINIYGKGLNEDGTIAGINIADYVTTVDKVVINKSDIECDEDTLQTEINTILAQYTPEGADDLLEWNDDFVKTYLDADETAESYKTIIKDEYEKELIEEALNDYLRDNTTVFKTPSEYFDNYFEARKRMYINQFQWQMQAYASMGYSLGIDSYLDFFNCENESDFDALIKEDCDLEFPLVLAKELIFKNAGLTVTEEDYNAYLEENGYTKSDVKLVGKGYIMQTLMIEKTDAYLLENVVIE